MFRLNRIKLFLLGVGVIMACYFARQLTFIAASAKADGIVLNVTNNDSLSMENTLLSYPMVGFSANGETYIFRGESNMNVAKGDTVKVIYRSSNPSNAHIYSFTGFWLRNILWFIIPLVLWAAFSLSYLDRNEHLAINLRNPFKSKRNKKDPGLPGDWSGHKKLE